MSDRFLRFVPVLVLILGVLLLVLSLMADYIGLSLSTEGTQFGKAQIIATAMSGGLILLALFLMTPIGHGLLLTRRRLVKFLAVWLAFFSVGLIGAELVGQVGYRLGTGHWFWEGCDETDGSRCPYYEADGPDYWKLRKNLRIQGRTDGHRWEIITNSEGHRVPEDRQVLLTRQRILVLGDSFTFGWGVNESERYGSLLDAELVRLGVESVLVQTIGVPNWGIAQELKYFQDAGLRMKPDLVVLQFFPFDWEVINSRNRHVVAGFLLRGSGQGGSGSRARVWLLTHLVGYREVRLAASRLVHLVRAVLPGARGGDDAMGPAQELTSKRLDAYSDEPYRQDMQAAVGEAVNKLDQMRSTMESAGGKLVILIVPAVFQLELDRLKQSNPRKNLTGTFDPEKPQRIMRALCQEHGWQCLDLLPYFKEHYAGNSESLYFPVDGHWSPKGHELAANVLAGWLIEQGLASVAR